MQASFMESDVSEFFEFGWKYRRLFALVAFIGCFRDIHSLDAGLMLVDLAAFLTIIAPGYMLLRYLGCDDGNAMVQLKLSARQVNNSAVDHSKIRPATLKERSPDDQAAQ